MPPRHLDLVELRRLIEVEQLQQWMAAERLGVSTSCVERNCKRLGLTTAKTGPRRGALHPDWQGGVTIRKGYRWIFAPWHPNAMATGYVAEHRMAMARKMKRPLLPDEVVHHIDGDRLNNQLENLMIFRTNRDHLQHELTGRIPKWTEDGKERIREGNRQKTIRRRSKRDGLQHTQTTGRPPSKP